MSALVLFRATRQPHGVPLPFTAMAKRKHPILLALALLASVALVMVITIVIVWKVMSPSTGMPFRDKIGVIPIEGVISDPTLITSQLIEFRKDDAVKAVVVRINSPGGAVGPTQEIYREIRRTLETKPVVASVGAVAASGGYYVASAARRIVAPSGAVMGSIGVLMEFIRAEELLDKIGISLEVLKSGEYKDMGSPHRTLTGKERDLIDELLADVQQQFVRDVAQGRNMDEEQVRAVADGRIFSAAKARELGLVDSLGNFHDAVLTAKELAGIAGEVKLVYPGKQPLQLLDLFLDRVAKSVFGLLEGRMPRLEYRWNGIGG